jgi:ABC-type antimicrobial peptide transport system permease subunit
MYVSSAQGLQSNVNFFVRFRSLPRGSESSYADQVRRVVTQVDPALPILSLQTFEQHLDGNFQLWVVRASAALFSVFGVLSLALAVVGLYGVKAYSVARRTREIGIRMALGAPAAEVLRMFMRESALTLITGITLGFFLAVGTGRLIGDLLYDVGALDPIAFTVAPLVLGVAALAATWFPARRATRVNPLTALRIG